MATKTSKSEAEEPEEEYPLVYNMWIENLTINAETVILQTGNPTPPPVPPRP
jgi:hypothetical protein